MIIITTVDFYLYSLFNIILRVEGKNQANNSNQTLHVHSFHMKIIFQFKYYTKCKFNVILMLTHNKSIIDKFNLNSEKKGSISFKGNEQK